MGGNFATIPQRVLSLLRKYFSSRLQDDDDDTNTAYRDVVPNPIYDDRVEILPPSHEGVKVVIVHLKNNKVSDPDGPTR